MFYNKAQTESNFPGGPSARRILSSKNSKLRQRAMTDNTAVAVSYEHICRHAWTPVGAEKHMHTDCLYERRTLPQCQRLRDFHAMKGFMELRVRKHKSISKHIYFLKMHSFIFEKNYTTDTADMLQREANSLLFCLFTFQNGISYIK